MNRSCPFSWWFFCAGTLCVVGRAHAVPTLVAIAVHDDLAPGGTGDFSSFGQLDGVSPAIDGENMAFGAVTDTSAGIYAYIDGELVVVADTTMTMPGFTERFGFPAIAGSGPSISGRNVVFTSRLPGPGEKIWLWKNGEFQLIADNTTPVPFGDGTFRTFKGGRGASPSVSGENVAFRGTWPADAPVIEGQGIYAYINGEIRMIADTNTVVPGRTEKFVDFGSGTLEGAASPSISGENVAFGGQWIEQSRNFEGSNRSGIYASINDKLILIAGLGVPPPWG